MKNLLKLIRWKNLLIIAFTLWFVRICVFYGLTEHRPNFPLDDFELILCTLSAVLVAIAAYLINDYLDQEIDKINKPDSRLVGRVYKEKSILYAYFIINIISLFPTIYVFKNHYLGLFLGIQLLAIFTFYFYTRYFKNRGLLGNLTVAFFSGIIPLGLLLLVSTDDEIIFFPMQAFYKIANVIFMYSAFAFLISLLREIVKDMEDKEGDKITGCLTFAVVQSEKTVKWTIAFILILSIALLIVFQIYLVSIHEILFAGNISFLYIVLILYVLPLLYKAKDKYDYRRISGLFKIIMMAGILMLASLLF